MLVLTSSASIDVRAMPSPGSVAAPTSPSDRGRRRRPDPAEPPDSRRGAKRRRLDVRSKRTDVAGGARRSVPPLRFAPLRFAPTVTDVASAPTLRAPRRCQSTTSGGHRRRARLPVGPLRVDRDRLGVDRSRVDHESSTRPLDVPESARRIRGEAPPLDAPTLGVAAHAPTLGVGSPTLGAGSVRAAERNRQRFGREIGESHRRRRWCR